MKPRFTILAVAAILALLIVVPASAENVYVDRNPALYEVLPTDAYGYVVFYVRGVSVQDPFVFIDTYPSDRVMDNSYHPDHTNITGQNAEMLMVEILPDGVSKPELLKAGEYIAYMRQGNGDQPEQYRFKIGGGATERVVFLGAAKPTILKETCEVFTILDKAGYIIHHDEVNHTVHHDAVTHTEVVVDKEAWDEIIEHPAETHVVHHDAVTHQETVVDVPAWDEVIHHNAITHTVHHLATGIPAQLVCVKYSYGAYCKEWDYEVGHVHARQNGNPSQTDFYYNGNPYHITGNKNGCAFIVTPAWDEVIVDTPAWDETIHHEAITHEETVVDVAAWDETVVDTEPWTETIHHDAITHEVTVTDKEAWDEIVVDVPAWDEQVGAITHKETVCSKYGNPVPPKGTIKTVF
jgi:hypothetical protein